MPEQPDGKKVPAAEADDSERLVTAIVDTANRLIARKTAKKSPKKQAMLQRGKHAQSITSMAYDSVLHNTLSGTQEFPARPREFRRQLGEGVQKIRRPRLSEILASLARTGLLINKRERFPIPRGARKKDSYLAEETRGVRSSYYEPSEVKKMVDRVLTDETLVRRLTDRLIQSGALHKLIKYGNSVLLHQAKMQEQSIFNTYRTAGLSEARTRLNSQAMRGSRQILVRDLTDELIEALADAYARAEITRYETDPRMVLYRLVAILTFLGLSDE